MHECPYCGEVCDCDQEDTWFENVYECKHECEEFEDDLENDLLEVSE